MQVAGIQRVRDLLEEVKIMVHYATDLGRGKGGFKILPCTGSPALFYDSGRGVFVQGTSQPGAPGVITMHLLMASATAKMQHHVKIVRAASAELKSDVASWLVAAEGRIEALRDALDEFYHPWSMIVPTL